MPIQITEKNWLNYLRALEKINEGAAEKVTDYLSEHEILSEEGRKNFLDYFYAIVTKYGEGSAEMACQMYDATAKAQGANVPPAEPAPTATYPETARAVNGSLFDSPSGAKLPGTAKRLVKQAGVDTTMKNAIRDGAEWAWVPHGDTCAFCLMMASNGWQRASKKALKNGHAQHIHGNCDCTYATRHDGKSGVKGYDPDKYKAMYDNAEGDRWQDKLNSMRRDLYAENKDRINEQKRIVYNVRKEQQRGTLTDVWDEYIKSSTPGEGRIIKENGRKVLNKEEQNAELLRDTIGGDVTLLDDRDNSRTNPDYRWRGKLWEEQELENESRNAIDQNTREAIKQIRAHEEAGGIILDISVCKDELDEIKGVVRHRLNRSSTIDCDVIFIRGKHIEGIFRYKK